MDFLENFDEGKGDAPSADPVYIDKQQPGHYFLSINEFGIQKRDEDHPDEPGEPFFLALLNVERQMQGQKDAPEGTEVSYFVNMSSRQLMTAAEANLKDLAKFLSAVTGEPMAYFLEKGKIKKRIMGVCDDADDYEGKVLEYEALDGKRSKSSGTTWYNPSWYEVDEDDIEAAAE